MMIVMKNPFKFLSTSAISRLTGLFFALVSLAACNQMQEEVDSAPKDFVRYPMHMEYQGRQLEYAVDYSPSADATRVTGRDAKEVTQILDAAPNGLLLFSAANELKFFQDKYEFFASTGIASAHAQRQDISVGEGQKVETVPNADVYFYRHINYVDQMDFRSVDGFTPEQNFVLYYNCGSVFNDNWCTDGVPNYARGFKVASVPSGTNDALSSVKITSTGHIKDFFVILFQHGNFGGRAIGLYLPANYQLSAYPSLKQLRRVAWFNGSWNDAVSSYQGFYYAY